MAYKVIILYQLYMPSYFLGTFTEYPYLSLPLAKNRKNDEIVYYSGLSVLFQLVRYYFGATGTGEHEITGRIVAAGAGTNP